MTERNPDRRDREADLEEFGERAFGDTLVIEVTGEEPLAELSEMVDRAEGGDTGPARLSLQPETLRQLLTPRRLELAEAIMAESPESIQALADRVDRSYPTVYEDLELLADVGVVVFRREGRANRPVIPYDRIEYSGVIVRDETPA
jgi:predicted transcriptional regulator